MTINVNNIEIEDILYINEIPYVIIECCIYPMLTCDLSSEIKVQRLSEYALRTRIELHMIQKTLGEIQQEKMAEILATTKNIFHNGINYLGGLPAEIKFVEGEL